MMVLIIGLRYPLVRLHTFAYLLLPEARYNMIDYHPDAELLVQHSHIDDTHAARLCS